MSNSTVLLIALFCIYTAGTITGYGVGKADTSVWILLVAACLAFTGGRLLGRFK